MALKTCPDCGHEVSNSAASCPKCGRPLKKKGGIGCLGVIIITVIIVLGLSYIAKDYYAYYAERSKKADTSAADLSLSACDAAQKAVKSGLKAPSTAKFPDCVFEAHKYEIRASEDSKRISVQGYVDSQNSFGAMIRSEFVVFLINENGRMTVEKMAIE